MNENPWSEDRLDFQSRTIPELKACGKDIGLSAQTGNQNALDIIKYYDMLTKSFDPMTHMLLKESLVEWRSTVKLVTITEKGNANVQI